MFIGNFVIEHNAMISELSYRSASKEDASSIASVYVDAWRSTYPGLIPSTVLLRMSKSAQARTWSQHLASKGSEGTVIVADRAGHGVVGFGSCGVARNTGLPQAGEIFTLYVSPEHQEMGVGRALLLHLFDSLAYQGMMSALVWVLALNPSRFFYEAMGGRRIAERCEMQWNTALAQTAYAWDDVRSLSSWANI